MAEYSRIDRRTWSDGRFRDLSADGKLTLLFLLSGSLTTSCLGLVHGGAGSVAEHRGADYAVVVDSIRELEDARIIAVDRSASVIRLRKCFEFDFDLPRNPNQLAHWMRDYDKVPDCRLKAEWREDLIAAVTPLGRGFVAVAERFRMPHLSDADRPSLFNCPETKVEPAQPTSPATNPETTPETSPETRGQTSPESSPSPTPISIPDSAAEVMEGGSAREGSVPPPPADSTPGPETGDPDPWEAAERMMAGIGIDARKRSEIRSRFSPEHVVRAAELTAEAAAEGRARKPSGYFLRLVEQDTLPPSAAELERERAAAAKESKAREEAVEHKKRERKRQAAAERERERVEAEEAAAGFLSCWERMVEAEREKIDAEVRERWPELARGSPPPVHLRREVWLERLGA